MGHQHGLAEQVLVAIDGHGPQRACGDQRLRGEQEGHPATVTETRLAPRSRGTVTHALAADRADDIASWLAYVTTMATHWTLGCDADDPQRLAAFWALALGYVKEPGFDEPDNA